MKRLARWISIAAHPFVVVLLLVGAVEAHRGPAAAARGVATVALLFVLPVAVLIVRQTRRGAWSTVDASDPRERPLLYLVGAAGLLALFGYLLLTQPATPLLRGAIGTLGMLAVCAAATPWVKVSLHVAVAALASAILLGLGMSFGWLLAAVVPVLAWARVAMGRHRWIEVVMGLVVGAAAGGLIVRWP
jgi:membrane-associated phospholipid phosphatase